MTDSENSASGPAAANVPSDYERARAIVALRDGYASDNLSLEDFSQALDAVLLARTRAELRELVPDVAIPAPMPQIPWTDAAPIARQLSAGEELLWIGRPDPSVRFTSADRFVVPFSLMWGGFAVFWESLAIAYGAPPFFILWGAMFVLVGCYFVFGRFIYKARRKRRTLYGVTTKRVVQVIRRRSGDQTETMLLQAIPAIAVTAGKHGRGMIAFGSTPAASAMQLNTGLDLMRGGSAGGVNFFDVPDADAVAQLVRRLQEHDRS